MDMGYSRSLAESLNEAKYQFALRFWIIDNSSSMDTNDGHRVTTQYRSSSLVHLRDCTRWQEISSCVEHHIQLASLLEAPTRFRLLNAPQNNSLETLSIAEGQLDATTECNFGRRWIQSARPYGLTPLSRHIRQIHQEISAMEPQLRQHGQRVSITIATDGLPTSEYSGRSTKADQNEFVECLRLLESLPVWLVIRLCTDDDAVVDFYNNIDSILELSLDVLDDLTAEAQEVQAVNPWMNYTLPLHRLREMGHHDRLFDLIDERKLTRTEVRDFCILLLGQDAFDGAPDPSADWKGFLQAVERAFEHSDEHWNPIRQRIKPVVSLKKLNRMYGSRSFW